MPSVNQEERCRLVDCDSQIETRISSEEDCTFVYMPMAFEFDWRTNKSTK